MVHKNKQSLLHTSKQNLPLSGKQILSLRDKIRILILGVIAIFCYINILNGFFQQDEWATFGAYIIHQRVGFVGIFKYLFAFDIGHYNPLTNLVQFTLFNLWGVNYINFAIFGIILHTVNVIGIYILAKRIFKKDIFLAFVTTLLFLFFAAYYQAIGWVVVNTATLSASFLGVVSAIFFYDYIEQKKLKLLFFSIVILFISLLFKEITIGLFPLYFLILFLLSKSNKNYYKSLKYVFVSGLLYFLFRVGMFFAPNTANDKVVTQTLSLSYLIYDFITLPFKSLSQIIFPQEVILTFSHILSAHFLTRFAGIPTTTKFDLFVLTHVVEPLSIVIGLIIIFCGIGLYLKKKSIFKNIILISLGWVILNSLIFSFAPETTNIITIVDSRNLYFIAIGVAFLIVSLLKSFGISNKKIVLILLPLVILNMYILSLDLSRLTKEGKVRKDILSQIYLEHPKLSGKTIFYIESDSSYYGLPLDTKILPFQSGFGQTLLVWYAKSQGFPEDFFKNRFLWDIGSQDYKEIDGIGFGYFRDFNMLYKSFSDNKLDVNSVISYSFNSNTQKLRDTTVEIKKRLLDEYLIQSRKYAK